MSILLQTLHGNKGIHTIIGLEHQQLSPSLQMNLLLRVYILSQCRESQVFMLTALNQIRTLVIKTSLLLWPEVLCITIYSILINAFQLITAVRLQKYHRKRLCSQIHSQVIILE